ncbi:hypothetical protein HDE78_000603 [Rhodanobacter sp. K2T2]|uniref:DUF4062 domain-containing protein n=1 Tax=Rhodanobacter sp. K2T2 TaxID=2723085 RepID=UPI0015C9A92F|nr:DUF4062 domain-containing protein [Rhodanobacter sp. K2T2]NYE27678.1 hypothetical protein [Rhodanobacter sp. K2T2]
MSSDDRKYQVFVSSTYQDLQQERQEIMHALLELDCIPSGMELFPAANEDQWSLIKGVIDDCDYYIVVVGGRYGSIGPDGHSFTEMEYRYAIKVGKPVIAFLHGDPTKIPVCLCEATDEGKEKLAVFRELVQKRMCKSWTTAHELGSVVSRSLVALKKQHPGVGWVRGDKVPTTDATTEMLKLRRRIEELESELNRSRTEPPKGATGLAQNDEVFGVNVDFETRKWDGVRHIEYLWSEAVHVSWNHLFFTVSPLLLHEATTDQIHARLASEIKDRVLTAFDDSDESAPLDEEHAGQKISSRNDIKVSRTDLETIVVQFLALGYITHSTKSRSVKDRGSYWTLTPFGTTVMNQLRAIPARPE